VRLKGTSGFALAQPARKPEQPRITVSQAEKLVYALLKPTGCTPHKCDVTRIENRYFPELYYLYVSWPNPVGSPHIDTFAVDPATADVWAADGCAEYRTVGLAKLQASMRRALGPDYRTRKRDPPACEPDEKVEIRTRH
jgi:hypothetical protein